MRPITTTRLLNAASPPDLSDATVDDDAAVVRLDSSSMAVTALVILLALFFLGFFSVYARRLFFAGSFHRSDSASYYSSNAGRRRASGTPQQLPPRRLRGSMFAPVCGLDPAALRSLPVLRYVGGGVGGGVGGVKDQGGCVVCLGEFAEKERVKVIPRCGHAFHPACIDAWLASRGSCPICRCTEMFRSDLSPEANAFTAPAAASINLDLRDGELMIGEGGERTREEDAGVTSEDGGRRREEKEEESAASAALASAAVMGRRSRSDRWRRDEAEEGRRVEDSAGMFLRRTCSI